MRIASSSDAAAHASFVEGLLPLLKPLALVGFTLLLTQLHGPPPPDRDKGLSHLLHVGARGDLLDDAHSHAERQRRSHNRSGCGAANRSLACRASPASRERACCVPRPRAAGRPPELRIVRAVMCAFPAPAGGKAPRALSHPLLACAPPRAWLAARLDRCGDAAAATTAARARPPLAHREHRDFGRRAARRCV